MQWFQKVFCEEIVTVPILSFSVKTSVCCFTKLFSVDQLSLARAIAQISIRFTPCDFSRTAIALTVAAVVTTSSTMATQLGIGLLNDELSRNARFIFALRLTALNWLCGGVLRALVNSDRAIGMPDPFDRVLAISSAWLNPLCLSRLGCSGTGMSNWGLLVGEFSLSCWR